MKTHKKAKLRKLYWVLAGFAAVIVVLVLLLLYRPAGFAEPEIASDGQVSRYLTHVLAPQFYNGAQRQEPFELVVVEEGVNDIVARWRWPKKFGGIEFSAPEVFFIPEGIVLIGPAVVGGMKVVVTIVGKAILDEKGLLHLSVSKVRVGAVGMTFIARVVTRRIYNQQISAADIETGDIVTQIAASLLDNEPFEPVFEAEDKKVRAEKITITHKRLTIRLVPVPD